MSCREKKEKKEKEKYGKSGRRITSLLPSQFCLLHGEPLVLGHAGHSRTVPVALVLTVTGRGRGRLATMAAVVVLPWSLEERKREHNDQANDEARRRKREP